MWLINLKLSNFRLNNLVLMEFWLASSKKHHINISKDSQVQFTGGQSIAFNVVRVGKRATLNFWPRNFCDWRISITYLSTYIGYTVADTVHFRIATSTVLGSSVRVLTGVCKQSNYVKIVDGVTRSEPDKWFSTNRSAIYLTSFGVMY